MAESGGRSDNPLSEKLLGEPGRFGFFQAVRLLERIAGPRGLVGEDRPVGDEAVRFRAAASTSFPASEVAAIRPPDEKARGLVERSSFQMVVTFMGLIGPKGVLPSYFTRLVQRRNRAKDQTLREFLDLFNHRAISLFYRAWAKYRFPIAYERERGRPVAVDDPFTSCLYSLVGLGTGGQRPPRSGFDLRLMPSLDDPSGIPAVGRYLIIVAAVGDALHVRIFDANGKVVVDTDETRLTGQGRRIEGLREQLEGRWPPHELTSGETGRIIATVRSIVGHPPRLATDERAFLYYAGLFAHFPRSAVTLEGMLADHYGLSVHLQQFTGQWLTLEKPDRTRLPGRSDRDEDCHNRLGWDAILGERAWDVASKFRIRLEGLSLDQFWRLLPSPVGDSLGPLGQLARIYAGPELDFDVQLVLRREEWARVELGREGQHMPMLGWNIWLRSFTLDVESDDAVFSSSIEEGRAG